MGAGATQLHPIGKCVTQQWVLGTSHSANRGWTKRRLKTRGNQVLAGAKSVPMNQ